MSFQHTISTSVSCTGVGLHNGREVTMRLVSAPENSGIMFRRTDLHGKAALVPARYDLVTDTRLGTTVMNKQGVFVSTIEHLMAALWGAGIDNLLIEIDAAEVPIMDGSSEPFMALLKKAGLKRQAAPRKIIRVLREVEIEDGKSTARVLPYEGEAEAGFVLDVEIDFDHPLIARQRAVYDFSQNGFEETLANARTFGFMHEVTALRAAGLARGGSLENAIVIGENGILNEEGLRSDDEFIRHKALDCVGDLFLAGYRIEGMFLFERPGHGINNKIIRALMADTGAWKLVQDAPEAKAAGAVECFAVL